MVLLCQHIKLKITEPHQDTCNSSKNFILTNLTEKFKFFEVLQHVVILRVL